MLVEYKEDVVSANGVLREKRKKSRISNYTTQHDICATKILYFNKTCRWAASCGECNILFTSSCRNLYAPRNTDKWILYFLLSLSQRVYLKAR